MSISIKVLPAATAVGTSEIDPLCDVNTATITAHWPIDKLASKSANKIPFTLFFHILFTIAFYEFRILLCDFETAWCFSFLIFHSFLLTFPEFLICRPF